MNPDASLPTTSTTPARNRCVQCPGGSADCGAAVEAESDRTEAPTVAATMNSRTVEFGGLVGHPDYTS